MPEPPAAMPGRGASAAPALPGGPSDWSAVVAGSQRAFLARVGVDLLGVGLISVHRLSAHGGLAADLLAEGATVVTASGVVSVLSVSSAPRVVVRAGGRLHGQLGLGARVGVVRLRGEALPGSQLAGGSLVRLWLGPAADAAVGFALAPRFSLRASAELGVVATGATARDMGEPVAALAGAWTSLGLGAAVEL